MIHFSVYNGAIKVYIHPNGGLTGSQSAKENFIMDLAQGQQYKFGVSGVTKTDTTEEFKAMSEV